MRKRILLTNMPLPNSFILIFLFLNFSLSASGASDGSFSPIYASPSSAVFMGTNPDLETIRARVIEDLLQAPIDESHVASLLHSIRAEGSWPDINYKDVSRTGFQHSRHLQNMYQLARAFKRPGSPFFQDKKMRKAALAALDFWLKNDFISDNWWWNEMGTPHAMINTLLVLDTDLTDDQAREGLRIAGRANLEASGARPGGDLIQIAGMLAKQALFRRDATVMKRVAEVMAEEIKIVSGRGLQADMSFHHRVDKVICTLSYGLGYANAFSYWAVKTAGTRYRLSNEATQLLTDYFLDGICKSMVHARYPDPGAKNRDLSRQGTLRPAGVELAENLLAVSDYRRAELEQVAAIRKGLKKPNFSWNQFYWHSEYFTHQRPDYFASVRMHSSRNHTVEQPHNEEGLKMHHLGDGANFISPTGEEYKDIFPVLDWQKIPGTTVVQKPVHPHWRQIAKRGRTDFVGGVSNGYYGAAAFDFKSAHDSVAAKKAWFFFDDEFVSLGADISAQADHRVVTTINQCWLDGNVQVRTKKEQTEPAKGTHSMSKVLWVLHDSIGYVFPDPETVQLRNTAATGRWRDINHQSNSSATPVQGDVFTLWLDHGVKPEEKHYAYIVVPGTSEENLKRYVDESPIEIVANSRALQAVTHKRLKRSQLVFYKAGTAKLENLEVSADSPCMIMVKTDGKNIEELTVSDPSRKLSEIRIRTNAKLEGSGVEWRATWDKKNKESIIDITLPVELYAGQSVVINMPSMHQ